MAAARAVQVDLEVARPVGLGIRPGSPAAEPDHWARMQVNGPGASGSGSVWEVSNRLRVRRPTVPVGLSPGRVGEPEPERLGVRAGWLSRELALPTQSTCLIIITIMKLVSVLGKIMHQDLNFKLTRKQRDQRRPGPAGWPPASSRLGHVH